MEGEFYTRWMIRRDWPAVLDIENRCFEFPWSEDELTRCLRQRNCIGYVATRQEQVVGFMIYELHKNRVHVLNFAVHPEWQHKGAGAEMIGRLKGKLSADRRNRIMLEVRETNLQAQLFFKKMGFRAISVLRSFYEETDEDAYLFQYRFSAETETPKLSLYNP